VLPQLLVHLLTNFFSHGLDDLEHLMRIQVKKLLMRMLLKLMRIILHVIHGDILLPGLDV